MRNVRTQYPKSLRHEIVRVYLTGENSYEELASIYNVPITNVRTWVARYRHSINVVSLRSETNPIEDMAAGRKRRNPPRCCSWRRAFANLSFRTWP